MNANPRTTTAYWYRETGSFRPFKVENNPFSRVLANFLPVDPGKTCVEIGAYPGGNLCYLTKRFGYKPYAIEYREDADDIRNLFRFNGLKDPYILQQDFFTVKDIQFDIVASFGFIEHFDDPQPVIQQHIDLLAPQGYLILSVPHFWGMQALFRHLTFTPEALDELYKTHNMNIMNLRSIRKMLQNAGITVLFYKHVMNAKFWIPADSRKIRQNRRWLAKFLVNFDTIIGSRLPSCFLYSPMILIIARKGEI